MATWILAGAASAVGYELVLGTITLLGFFNTSVQGISNISRMLRDDKNNIMELVDDELLLDVRINVLNSFLQELTEIRVDKETIIMLQNISPKITKCIIQINNKLQQIKKKDTYNKSLWVFKNIRKYRFTEDEEELRKLSDKLEKLEKMFFSQIERDGNYRLFLLKKQAFSVENLMKNTDKEKLFHDIIKSSRLQETNDYMKKSCLF